MEGNLEYCADSERRRPDVDSSQPQDTMPFRCHPGMQSPWKTTKQEWNMAAECQIDTPLSPYIYSTSNRSCMCPSRYRTVNSSCRNTTFTSPDNDSAKLKISEEQYSDNKSISKILKFGIERILTDKAKGILECMSDTAAASFNNVHIPKTESASKRRRKNGTRSVFSYLQRSLLEKHYQRWEYVTKTERYHIALEVGITEDQVKIWFQNRRTKKKKIEKKEKNKSSAEKSQEPEWLE